MNQCACDCHKTGIKKCCYACHKTIFLCVHGRREENCDICKLEQKLEAQQKDIEWLKKLAINSQPNGLYCSHGIGHFSERACSICTPESSSWYKDIQERFIKLEKQRDVGIERIKKLEEAAIWQEDSRSYLTKEKINLENRIGKLESKLSQQNSVPYLSQKKTKTLWIGVSKRKNQNGNHQTTSAYDKEWTPDNTNIQQVVKIEIEVPE